ncbi:MAG: glycosyltransferase family 2 protein [Balneolales bacterium]|nr:glycosyltransferase family 2 protein [Balneolales bacterium]
MMYSILAGIVLFYSLYMFLTVLIGLFYKVPAFNTEQSEINNHRLLVFYPVYKPGKKVIETIAEQKKELTGLDSQVYVLSQEAEPAMNAQLEKVADYLDQQRFSHLKGNSYHHALEFAVNRINGFDNFDSVLLLDPDNIIDGYSIRRLIASRIQGNHVALSRRRSYRQNTSTSLFDGLSERLNDYMFRRAKKMLGFIPELSGSGMVMDTSLFTSAVKRLDKKAPGMDKQLLINMMFECESLSISYDEKAIVMDEKTEEDSQFGRQRLRWFGNQYYNAKKFGLKLLTSSNSAHIDYGITLWRLPRSFQVIGTMVLFPLDTLAFFLGWIAFPVIGLSALLSSAAIFLFLCKEGVVKEVLKTAIPVIKTALKNGWLASRSIQKKNEGVFIHTRNK